MGPLCKSTEYRARFRFRRGSGGNRYTDTVIVEREQAVSNESRSWPWLVLGLFMIVLSWNVAEAGSGPYSVQVKAVPLADKASALALYERLKANGHLAYYYIERIDDRLWMRVRVGAFDSIDEARTLGELLAEREGLDFYIARSPVQLRRHGPSRLVIAPSGVWVEHGGEPRELVHAGAKTTSQAVDVDADLSPDGRQIAVMHGDALTVYEAAGGNLLFRIGETGSIMPRVRYSPDGQWIAFQPLRDFEGEFSLWVLPSAGGEPRRLIDTTGTSRTIRSFVWHPSAPLIYYVEGQAWGAVSKGGRILVTGLDGEPRVFLEPQGQREEFAGELSVRDRALHYRVIRFDENYNHYTATRAQAALP